MTKLFAMAIPILPGKTEQWRKFTNALKNEKFNDIKASRRRLGVRERAFFQHTPQGDLVIVTLEGEDPASAFAKFAAANDEFTKWFAKQVKEVHGIDLASPPPKDAMPELVVDTGELKLATA